MMISPETLRAEQGQEQAPATAEIDVCTADRSIIYMNMTMKGRPEAITYPLWGQTATDLRETVAHFTFDQVKNDDDLFMAALDNFGLKFELKNKFGITGGASGAPPHKCQEPPRGTPLPELYVGQVDVCAADKSQTISVIYGITTNPSPAFRDALVAAIDRTVSTYAGDMNRPDGMHEALTKSIQGVEDAGNGQTFFYFAPSGARQEGCHPRQLAL